VSCLLVSDHSEVVHCSGVLGMLCEYLPVKLVSFAQPSRLVVLHRQTKGLLDGQLGHLANSRYRPRAYGAEDVAWHQLCHIRR